MIHDPTHSWIAQQALHLTGETPIFPVRIFDDTTNFMYIERGHIVRLEGEYYLVRGNEKEGRFGLDEQPKFWVKRAIALSSGRKCILKLACQETFKVQVGPFPITCTRDAEKEARVLELVRGDPRFMQGSTRRDRCGNPVHVIDFISGADLLTHVAAIDVSHREYFRLFFPSILARTFASCQAIRFLAENGLNHGDIRNDHILVETGTGRFRWIDFDLRQDFPDFDLWSLGNILHCITAKGFLNFRDVIRDRPELSGRLTNDDASAFFPHRIMNLGKVYPYLPERLNRILLRFSQGTRLYYDSVAQLTDDLSECLEILPAGAETAGYTAADGPNPPSR